MTELPTVPSTSPAGVPVPIETPRLRLLASDDEALLCTDDLCLPAGFEAASPAGLEPAPAAGADRAVRARQPEEPAR